MWLFRKFEKKRRRPKRPAHSGQKRAPIVPCPKHHNIFFFQKPHVHFFTSCRCISRPHHHPTRQHERRHRHSRNKNGLVHIALFTPQRSRPPKTTEYCAYFPATEHTAPISHHVLLFFLTLLLCRSAHVQKDQKAPSRQHVVLPQPHPILS